MAAQETGRPIGEIDLPRSRFPLKPIDLGTLAALELPASEQRGEASTDQGPGMDIGRSKPQRALLEDTE